ncbi:FtsX-like permease family protein [Baia soyae]|uniref:Putative ABC transport system permease protein n=1 Tax=Baia soyae TaxID=1544746 RepID=A0A4V2SYH5_9BACL|nr:ABC transporter permease [Baia soyae]TCP70561.1 putative ABC transport system permease protein [Baia soyae]
MNFRQFAFYNVRRNIYTYIAYFLSSSFAVMTFFTYLMFIFHPEISNAPLGGFVSIGMKLSSYVIFTFSILFVMFSLSDFLKARLKEFGVLTILGAQRKQLNYLIFLENLIIGTAAVITGISTGFLFSKLFFMIASHILDMKPLHTYLSMKAIWITATAFMSLFVIISIMTNVFIRQSKAIEIIKGTIKPKKEPKVSIWLALLSVVTLLISVFLLQGSLPLLAIPFDIIGLYFFFTQLTVLIVRQLKKNRHYYWRGLNLLWISEMAYKLKDNARMFFIVTVVTVMSCTSAGLILGVQKQSHQEFTKMPFAFTVNSDYHGENGQKTTQLMQKIEQTLHQQKTEHQKISNKRMITPFTNTKGIFFLTRQSDYVNLAKSLSLPSISLQPNEALLISSTVSKNKPEKDLQHLSFKESGLPTLQIKKQIEQTIFGTYNLVIVSDQTYAQVKPTLSLLADEVVTYQYAIPSWSNPKDIISSNSIEAKIGMELKSWYQSTYGNKQLDSDFSTRAADFQLFKQGINFTMLIGLFNVAIFLIFTASFLYFKLFTDLRHDQRYYHGLSRMGLSNKEMRNVATKQIALLFYIPLFFAGIQTLGCVLKLFSISLSQSKNGSQIYKRQKRGG